MATRGRPRCSHGTQDEITTGIEPKSTMGRCYPGVLLAYLRVAQALSRGAIHPYLPGCDFRCPIDAALPSCERTRLGRYCAGGIHLLAENCEPMSFGRT